MPEIEAARTLLSDAVTLGILIGCVVLALGAVATLVTKVGA